MFLFLMSWESYPFNLPLTKIGLERLFARNDLVESRPNLNHITRVFNGILKGNKKKYQ